MASNELDALMGQFAACEMLAFADLSTSMILTTDSDTTLPREALDKLCVEASTLLGTGGNPSLGEHSPDAAYVANAQDMRIYLRARDLPDEVLCCVCSHTLDIDAFVAKARLCLQTLSGG